MRGNKIKESAMTIKVKGVIIEAQTQAEAYKIAKLLGLDKK